MLNVIKTFIDNKELLNGKIGIEREALRVDSTGKLSNKPHPKEFGGKISNQYITTDFSESQIELITPTFDTSEEVYNFLNILYDIVALEIKDEYLWPQSMPCNIPEDKDIPLAKYDDDCEDGKMAREYREKLFKKYGGKKQLISGIHYNFSYNEGLIKKLYEETDKEIEYRVFRDNIYLKVARNYLRYRWLLIYLLGGTATVHESYHDQCIQRIEGSNLECFGGKKAVSYRNSECGYKNDIDLFPKYDTIENYVNSIKGFINNGNIENHKELYSQVRIKAKDNNNFLNSLLEDGINYLEMRSIDINPFDKAGISLEDLKFIHMFNLFLLAVDEDDYEKWQEEALYNQNIIAKYGQQNVKLKKNGILVDKVEWGLDIINRISAINNDLDLIDSEIINSMSERILDHKLTYAYRVIKEVEKHGFIQTHLNLAKEYSKTSYENRFRLEGFEDLELSTQILMKEAIKRGIKVDIIDRSENFIALRNSEKVEYVKQATKTSKDNYITVLMMENKVVTKKVLMENNIRVPLGEEFNSVDEAKNKLNSFINKPIVIKPKSTNFGLGISIFPNGTSREDIIEALVIAFKYDKTVLIEEFIKGKEYRFLVVGDKVLGILHRVPANVVGDGKRTIEELVQIKNQSPLRGKGYKTPLEKIELDENAKLFLKQRNLDFDYIPNKDEIVYLRENSNISTGGDSIDYTDDIPAKFKNIAIKASKAIGANICGVDMMIEDYNNEDSNYSIIELNFNPAIHIHSYPYKGLERNIAKEVLNILGIITCKH